MARSFGDIGESIFGWFFTRNDAKNTFQVSTKSKSTGFSVSRTIKDDNTVSAALTATKDFTDSRYISSIDYTISNTDNVSVDFQSDLFKHRNVSLSASMFDPPEPKGTLEIGYNDQKKYSLDMTINTDFNSMFTPDINLSTTMDSLMNNTLCIGIDTHWPSSTQKEQSIGFESGAEYQWNEDTVFAVKGNESLKEMEFGFMKSQFRGNGNDTLFGRMVAGVDELD